EEAGADRHVIVSNLGACGISCRKCGVYREGDICYHSNELLSLLGSLDTSAATSERAQQQQGYNHYAEFQEILQRLAEPTCEGCRHGGPTPGNCRIVTCVRERGLDFCHECSEFPCD